LMGRGACLIRPKDILYKAMKLGQSLITFLKRLSPKELPISLRQVHTICHGGKSNGFG